MNTYNTFLNREQGSELRSHIAKPWFDAPLVALKIIEDFSPAVPLYSKHKFGVFFIFPIQLLHQILFADLPLNFFNNSIHNLALIIDFGIKILFQELYILIYQFFH